MIRPKLRSGARKYKVATEDSKEAFSGQMVPLDVEESEKVQKVVTVNSRKRYAIARTEVEKQMEALFSDRTLTKEKKRVAVTKHKESKASPENKLRGL